MQRKKQTLLKKFQLFGGLLCSLLVAGCCADKSYNVTLLGDIHYDHVKYHDMSKMKHLGIPQAKYVYNKDGYFSWRNHSIWTTINQGGSVEKNTPLNMNMWKKYMPSLLDGAAAEAKKCNSRCTIQLGDLIHGDCYNVDLNKQNLQKAIGQLTGRFNKSFVVSGNHDSADQVAYCGHILSGAGVHFYNDDADAAVYANASYVALHNARAGRRTIRLPHAARVTELYPEHRPVSASCSEFSFDSRGPATTIFLVEK